MKIIDLFSGCGGLSLGFIERGHQIVKAVEIDSSIANTYKMNHPEVDVIVGDIKELDTGGAFQRGEADLIVGGPPCQGFSMAGARIRNGFIDDPRNYLFKHYFNVVKTVMPKAFIMENVKGLLTMQNGRIFNQIKEIFSNPQLLEGQSYTIHYKVVKAVDFGIPQKRERVIIIGTLNNNYAFETLWDQSMLDIQNMIPTFFEKVTVRDAIEGLPAPSDDGMVKNTPPKSNYQKYLSCGSSILQNHIQTKHSIKALERIKKIKMGENYESLCEKIKSVHSGAYGRLDWDLPAQTITTRFDTPAGGRFIHPVENRTITPREAARIQSFPDDFVFFGSKSSICKQIGNAVPPKISYFLACFCENILKGN